MLPSVQSSLFSQQFPSDRILVTASHISCVLPLRALWYVETVTLQPQTESIFSQAAHVETFQISDEWKEVSFLRFLVDKISSLLFVIRPHLKSLKLWKWIHVLQEHGCIHTCKFHNPLRPLCNLKPENLEAVHTASTERDVPFHACCSMFSTSSVLFWIAHTVLAITLRSCI